MLELPAAPSVTRSTSPTRWRTRQTRQRTARPYTGSVHELVHARATLSCTTMSDQIYSIRKTHHLSPLILISRCSCTDSEVPPYFPVSISHQNIENRVARKILNKAFERNHHLFFFVCLNCWHIPLLKSMMKR